MVQSSRVLAGKVPELESQIREEIAQKQQMEQDLGVGAPEKAGRGEGGRSIEFETFPPHGSLDCLGPLSVHHLPKTLGSSQPLRPDSPVRSPDRPLMPAAIVPVQTFQLCSQGPIFERRLITFTKKFPTKNSKCLGFVFVRRVCQTQSAKF